jgi:hypothetical protein
VKNWCIKKKEKVTKLSTVTFAFLPGNSLSCWPTGAAFFSRIHFNLEKYFSKHVCFYMKMAENAFLAFANRVLNNCRIKIDTMCKTCV